MFNREKILELIDSYDHSLSATPLLTAIQEMPTSDDFKEVASLPIFDLTPYLIPDMFYRFYKGMNYFLFFLGNRGFFKSSAALWCAWMSSIIGEFALPKNYESFIVDDNNSMLDTLMEEKPKFFTAIKDEHDTKQSGAGTQSLSAILSDQINRIRGRQYNIIICTPEDHDFPVDFKFITWRFLRKPIENAYARFLVEYQGMIVGHVNIPLPPQPILKAYHEGIKQKFLKRTQTLEDPMLNTIKKVIDKLMKDNDFPRRVTDNRISNIFDRMMYISEKYPYLTEGIKKNIERHIALKESDGIR